MKSLKQLNLRNNSIALLPRKIDVMTKLEKLDLSRLGPSYILLFTSHSS
jgi:Leucine-rich repeat (LRR) protein